MGKALSSTRPHQAQRSRRLPRAGSLSQLARLAAACSHGYQSAGPRSLRCRREGRTVCGAGMQGLPAVRTVWMRPYHAGSIAFMMATSELVRGDATSGSAMWTTCSTWTAGPPALCAL